MTNPKSDPDSAPSEGETQSEYQYPHWNCHCGRMAKFAATPPGISGYVHLDGTDSAECKERLNYPFD